MEPREIRSTRRGADMDGTCYSYSRLSAFDDCPKKYELCYVQRVARPSDTIEAFMGSRVHEALERLYRDVRMGRAPSADDLVGVYGQAWDAAWTPTVRVVREDYTPEDYRAVGERALRAYHARYAPFDDGVTVGLEQRIDLDLDGTGAYRLTGFVDRLVRISDGVWEIHDYKTGQRLPTQADSDADVQLALYELAVRDMYPDVREVTLVWHYVVFDVELRSRRTSEQLEELRRDTIARIDAVARAKDFPTRTGALCDWCEYRALCPSHRHASEVAALAADERVAEPGVALVDRYVELSARICELEAERERVKDAIDRRSAQEGVDVMVGTEQALKLFRYRNIGLPAWDDPRRAEVERIVREAGLRDGFSALSSVKLSKALESGAVPADVVERLDGYLRVSESMKLYPRRLGKGRR
jgi:putative RecB family exonuclease